MRKFFLMSALCLAAALAFTGCKSTTPPEDLQNVPEALDDPSGNGGRFGNGGGTGLDSDGGRGFGAGANGGAWNAGANEASVGGGANGADADGWAPADPSGNRLGMPIIYCAYDSEQLRDIAEFLGKNQALCLVIEGHCDQRGTDEYNRSLGERRANAIRAYLAERGVADNRMKTVSYGKDQPAVQGNDESAWRKNRRGVPVPMKVTR